MRNVVPTVVVGVFATSVAAPAFAEQPMDRFERMIESGRADEVVVQARKWLERNIIDDRRPAVSALLHEAAYAVLLQEPSVAAAQRYQATYPKSARVGDARRLEANLALYDAAAFGTEDAYLDVAQSYAGTPAGSEARQRAMSVAFEAAAATGTSEAWGGFLDDYPESGRSDEALRAYREALWSESEAEASVAAWLRLRSSDPDHPRAAEALEREAALAVADLPDDASFRRLNKTLRRYASTEAGRTLLPRALPFVEVTPVTGDADDETAPFGAESATVRTAFGVTARWPGPVPDGVEVAAEWVVLGEEPRPWSERASELAEEWGVAPLQPAPVCRVGDERFGVRVSLEVAGWDTLEAVRPVEVLAACVGPAPFRWTEDEGGRLTSIDAGNGEFTPLPSFAGLDWSCSSEFRGDLRGWFASCAGRELRVDTLPEGTWIRPASDAPILGREDDEERRPQWPSAALFAPESTCRETSPLGLVAEEALEETPLPAPTSEEATGSDPTLNDDPAPVPAGPPRPDWLHAETEVFEERIDDFDGDGRLDLTLAVAGMEQQRWLIAVRAAEPTWAWVSSVAEGALPPLHLDCDRVRVRPSDEWEGSSSGGDVGEDAAPQAEPTDGESPPPG